MKLFRVSSNVIFSLSFGIVMLVSLACGTHVGNPEEEGSKGGPVLNQPRDEEERVTFALAHGSYQGAEKLDLYIESLSIRSAYDDGDESAWISIPLDSSEPIDLLSFRAGDFYNIAGSQSIPDGIYNELRLILDSEQAAVMTLQDGSVHQLRIPSVSESGIKIKGEINIDGEQDNIYVMNFDLERSIIKTGPGEDRGNAGRGMPPIDPPGRQLLQGSGAATYLLRPVIQLVREQESGGIRGEAANGNLVCVYADISEADDTDDCENAIATGRVKNGRYHLPFLAQGIYDMRIFDSEGNYEDVLGIEVERRTGRL